MAALGLVSVTLAAFAASLTVTANASTAPAAGRRLSGTELGFTAMIGVPLVTVAVTVYEPANTDCVVSTPCSPARTSTASVMRPDSVLMARRAAISLPEALLGMSTAAGFTFSTSAARISACGATRYAADSASSTT